MKTNCRFSAALVPLALLLCCATSLGFPDPGWAAVTPQGQQGCASGTVVGGPNQVRNGDFAVDAGPGPGIDPAAEFESDLPNRGPGIYPDDNGGGGFSIQTGSVSYFNDVVIGRPFPGDPQRDVPATQTYFYSNPNVDKNGNPPPFVGTLWRQQVAVTERTTYNFFAYFDNLLIPGAYGVDPVLELRVDGVAAGPPVVVAKEPDRWTPIQYAFTTGVGQTVVTLEIFDLAGDVAGDDFGMTQISLKQCVSSIGVSKSVRPPKELNDGSYEVAYTITLRNYGSDPLPLSEIQVRDNLAATFSAAASFELLSLSSPTLTVNPAFDGVGETRLLSGTDTLASGEAATIVFAVRVIPGSGPGGSGPFGNGVNATARAGTLLVQDESSPGTNPDPNGNGDPKEPNEGHPTDVVLGRYLLSLPLVVH